VNERTDCNVAILFADVSGSTTLYEKLGDARALAAVSGVVELLSKCVAAHGGRVVKTIGDEVMAALPTAAAALEAASDMQNRLSALAPIEGVRLAIRVGFHYGPAIAEGGDYFGDAVNTAARLAGLARAGQIITTSATVAALPELLRASTRELDALPVKGKEAPVRIAEVIWDAGDDLTMLADRAVATAGGSLALEHAGGRIVMGSERPVVRMGRDAAGDIVIADKKASRGHGTIEYRGGHFVLTDRSTNGTFVQIDGDAEVALRREQIVLRGRGTIAFGHSAAEPDAEVVRFVLD
jgi:class 3 adenylate cyclase